MMPKRSHASPRFPIQHGSLTSRTTELSQHAPFPPRVQHIVFFDSCSRPRGPRPGHKNDCPSPGEIRRLTAWGCSQTRLNPYRNHFSQTAARGRSGATFVLLPVSRSGRLGLPRRRPDRLVADAGFSGEQPKALGPRGRSDGRSLVRDELARACGTRCGAPGAAKRATFRRVDEPQIAVRMPLLRDRSPSLPPLLPHDWHSQIPQRRFHICCSRAGAGPGRTAQRPAAGPRRSLGHPGFHPPGRPTAPNRSIALALRRSPPR